jgi:ATP/maltotriose-dependent transcriptional regulator MalT
MWRGRWRDAEAQFEAAVEAYSRARPASVGGALSGLAELRRRQGRPEDAERLLGRAAALVCRARLALDRGDARQALELAERSLRQVRAPMKVLRAPALEVAIASAAQLGRVRRAKATLAELEQVARLAGTEPMRAAARLAGAIVAGAAGDRERARPLLEDAVDGFERSGAPFEAALARLELAKGLIALGRGGDAAREARAALERLVALGAEAEARRARAILDKATSAVPAPVPEVTRREREVLRCLTAGLTNRQIADRLFVSAHTVHRHVASILRKLDLPTRAAAAAHAARAGLIPGAR